MRDLKYLRVIIISVFLSGGLISCITTPVTVTSSTTPLQGKKIEENFGKTTGSHMTGSILGLFMIGKPDIDKALDRALKEKGGDALINVRCYEQTMWFVLFGLHKVIIEGEVVKLGEEKAEEKVQEKEGTNIKPVKKKKRKK